MRSSAVSGSCVPAALSSSTRPCAAAAITAGKAVAVHAPRELCFECLVRARGDLAPQDAADEARGVAHALELDARFDAHPVQHVEQVFGCEVARGARGVRTAAEARARGIEDRDVHLQRRQRRWRARFRAYRGSAWRAVRPAGALRSAAHDVDDLVRRRDADRIADRKFVDAHLGQRVGDAHDAFRSAPGLRRDSRRPSKCRRGPTCPRAAPRRRRRGKRRATRRSSC